MSYKQATRVRLLHPAPVRMPRPGIAQLAERAIDNREAVGSTPTPWTIFERASPSGKAPGFQPGTAWVRIPPPAPSLRLARLPRSVFIDVGKISRQCREIRFDCTTVFLRCAILEITQLKHEIAPYKTESRHKVARFGRKWRDPNGTHPSTLSALSADL